MKTAVFADTFFGSKGSFLRQKAVVITRRIFANKNIRVLPQTHETFQAGLDFYAARPDKGYSLTDCISMVVLGPALPGLPGTLL